MAPRTIDINPDLARSIRMRRENLGLTIEEAAQRAGIGVKSWSRYEAGGAIRIDKVPLLCKALKWKQLPDIINIKFLNKSAREYPFENIENHEFWPSAVYKAYGKKAAASFAVGSDILMDHIEEDLGELSSMPRGTHIGELSISWLIDMLPTQFLMRYDYEFLFGLRCSVFDLRMDAKFGRMPIAHRLIDEIALWMMLEESRNLMEEWDSEDVTEDDELWDSWVGEICGDNDVLFFLHDDLVCWPGNPYHFDRWFEPQFWSQEDGRD